MWGWHLRRWWAAHNAQHADMRTFLQSPLPSKEQDIRQVSALVLDLESTGLSIEKDAIVSVAWVPVNQGRLYPGLYRSMLVQTEQSVGNSATVHGITDHQLRTAYPLQEVLLALLKDLAGKLLVVHHKRLDIGLLNRECQACFGAPLHHPVIDTLQVQQRWLAARNLPVSHGQLRLNACRAQYGLPAADMHDALGDALATGELFLAQVATLAGHDGLPWKRLW